MSSDGNKTYNNRARKQLMEKIRDLSQMEHAEIFKIVRECMPEVNFTQNANGMFFNMSSFNDEVLQRLEAFVNFCNDNKKDLDDYDKRLKHCKFVVAAAPETPVEVSSACDDDVQNDDPDELVSSTKFEQTWKNVLNDSEDAIAVAKALYNSDRTAKKKVYTKFHAAKKRFSKRVATDKRCDSELMNELDKI